MSKIFILEENKVKNLQSIKFESEKEIEDILSKNINMIEEGLVFIGRQISTHTRENILDLLAIDATGRLAIIELKKEKADEKTIVQTLRYLIWVNKNSTAVERNVNEKFTEEEIKIDWEQTPKVMIVAPTIDRDLLILQNFLNIDVEFFEIGVYLHQGNKMIVLTPKNIPEESKPNVRISKSEDYDLDWSCSRTSKENAKLLRNIVVDIENLNETRGWDLQRRHTKTYISFQKNRSIRIYIEPKKRKGHYLYLKLGEKKQQAIERGFKEQKNSKYIYISINSIEKYKEIVDLLEITAVEI